MKKRLLASLLSLAMVLTMLPSAALAAGLEDEGLCPHHTEHAADCGYVAAAEGTPCTHAHTAECYSNGALPADGEEKEADACTHVHDAECGYSEGSEGSPCTFVCSICPVEAMIEALPAYADAVPDDVAGIEVAQAAYDALGEERAAVDSALVEKLEGLTQWAEIVTATSDVGTYVSEAAEGELNISQGSIIITETGYKQGDSEETKWDGNDKKLTITQMNSSVATSNTISVTGGTVEITLKGVNLNGSDGLYGAFWICGNATVDLILCGENILETKKDGYAALGIEQGSAVTIQVPDGCKNSDGVLNATASYGSAGIGAGHNRPAGTINIKSGTVVATGNSKGAGIGGARGSGSVEKINISGGHVTNLGNHPLGGGENHTSELSISGGTIISASGLYDSATSFSITGGNIGDAYNGAIEGRTLTKLTFFDAEGNALADTEVTVTEGDHEWTALTDDEGMVTTYLDDETKSVSVAIGTDGAENVTITNGTGVVGAKCTCSPDTGTLTMITQSQGLTVTNGTATLELEADYKAAGDCVLPDGFHGDYENISYEITKVVKNGQYQTTNRYATISGSTLTVYDETNADSYTVYVKAVSGPEGSTVESEEIAISVGTYVSEVDEGELDIGLGSIIITESGYSQGTLVYTSSGENAGYSVQGAEGAAADVISWGEDPHALTITGSSTTSTILIMGGSPEITLRDVSILQESANTPGLVLMSGPEESDNTATLVLEGTNTLTGSGAPGVQINKNATLTIQGDGALNATGATNHAGIGATNGSTFVVDPSSKTDDNNFRAGGNLVIEGGTITAVSSGDGQRQNAGLGNSRSIAFGDITIEGGTVQATGRMHGIRTDGGDVTISGGSVSVNITNSGNPYYAIGGQSVTVSGGTLASLLLGSDQLTGKNALRATGKDATVSITGGNVNSYYAENIEERTLTKLYFVNKDGTPKANTLVTMQEGESAAWSAYTDENGVVTTYFASNTEKIKADVGSTASTEVALANSQALIGGTCTCTAFSGIEWNSGLPETVTLYQDDQTITVADAELVTTDTCAMPIHPNLPAIIYSLAVKDSGGVDVNSESLSNYAELSGNTLTLKKQNAPYTVTLTASAGEQTATCIVQVQSGDTTEGSATISLTDGRTVTITYDETNGYTASWGEGETEKVTSQSGSFVLTGSDPTASITVSGCTPSLTLNQASADNVWTLYTSGEGTSVTLDAAAVNGKVRFGAEGAYEAVQGVLTAEKLKLNPEAGASITIDETGNVTQGEFSISGLGSRTLAVYGANPDGETTIANNSGTEVSVDANDSQSTLAADSSITIPKANAIFNGGPEVSGGNDDNVRGYIYDNGTKLVYAGEGVATVGDREVWSTEENLPYRDTVTQAAFDPDISTVGYAVIYLLSGIEKLEIKYATTVAGLYNALMKELWLGEQVTTYASGTYLYNLETITLAEGNTALTLDDGVLYTADGTTLLQCPQGKTGSYTLLDTCRAIPGGTNGCPFFNSNLSTLILNAGLTSIGDRVFEEAKIQNIQVEAGNTAFQSIDGVLYTADGKTMILCPAGRTESELVIPEGVTGMAAMAAWQLSNVTSITLPASLESVDGYFLANAPIEEMIINGTLNRSSSYAHRLFFNSQVLHSLTVPEGYDFVGSTLFGKTSMNWVTGITVTGGEDVPYDGKSHGVDVTGPEGATVEYSTDGVTYYAAADHMYINPGTYTVYWRVTYDDGTVYSQATFTITALEASEDWFTLTAVKPDGVGEDVTPVALSQPAAAPSLEGGYTVYYKADGGTPTEEVPAETGSYLVTVEITAEGYVNETLTLGYYTIPEENQVVISFITYGGPAIKPITGTAGNSITWPDDPKYPGYEFGGWYEDADLRTPLEDDLSSMPDKNTPYYAEWRRLDYTISYEDRFGATNNNPDTYHVETPTFTLNAPSLPGYLFKGWKEDDAITASPTVTIKKGTTGNKTYTAVWEKITYNITYPYDYDKVDGNPTSYTVETTQNNGISLTSPTARQGYTFSGWTMVVDSISYILPATGAEIPQGTLGDIILTGIWLADDQTITLNANGGTFANGSMTATITAEYGSSITLTTPTRSGYTFAGWYMDKECTTPFTGTTMPLTTTLYAGWKALPTDGGDDGDDDGNGGSGGGSSGSSSSGGSTRYTISVDAGRNGDVTVSPSRAKRGDTVTITVAPDEGYELDELTVTDSDGDEIDVERVSSTKYTFEMPRGRVTVEATFVEITEEPDLLTFTDVPESAYYYDAVYWAVENGVTNGTGEAIFSPDAVCTRAQMVTFLWRAAGSPEPESTINPFSDVPASAYYYDAVLWAVEQGITNGTSSTTFGPDITVTRGQTVTFLWRYDGSPAVSGSAFADVAADAYYADAVTWAASEGITSGTSATTFSPDNNCTRGQIVTFLYRYLG